VIAKHTQSLTCVEPDLTLRGLYVLHVRNVAGASLSSSAPR
jgi:hypothetical protein